MGEAHLNITPRLWPVAKDRRLMREAHFSSIKAYAKDRRLMQQGTYGPKAGSLLDNWRPAVAIV